MKYCVFPLLFIHFLILCGEKKKNRPNIICINIIQYNKLDKAAQFYIYKTKKNQSTSDLYSLLTDTHSPILGIMSGEMVVQACRFGGSAPNLIVISYLILYLCTIFNKWNSSLPSQIPKLCWFQAWDKKKD